jgi:hypothetical protein
MDSAEEIGRINGRNNDWVPVDIGKAIDEIELISDCSSNGYEIIGYDIRMV